MSFVFYASVFTAVSTHTPLMVKLIYAAIIVAQFGAWFIIVGMFFSNKRVQDVFNNYRDWINRLTGTVLIYFAYNLISGALQ
jgi:threonine/homoserine/homoserine lactone efflux protein